MKELLNLVEKFRALKSENEVVTVWGIQPLEGWGERNCTCLLHNTAFALFLLKSLNFPFDLYLAFYRNVKKAVHIFIQIIFMKY